MSTKTWVEAWLGCVGLTSDKDPGPSATDRVIQRPVHSGSIPEPALRKAIREVAEDRDSEPSATDSGSEKEVHVSWEWEKPEQGATDRGSGPEFPVHGMMKATVDAELRDNGSYLDALPLLDVNKCVQLPPEVLAQLKRIEDMLSGLVNLVDMVLPEKPIVIRRAKGNYVIRELDQADG